MTRTSLYSDKNTTSSVTSKDGSTISYLSLGEGPAVLVIPGALSTASDYLEFARAMAEHFTVFIIERRGRGQSSPQGEDYSIVKECEDVQALLQKTGASLLVGHSFGGLVALETARNTTTISKIAVYEPGVSIDGSIPMGWIPGYEKKLAEKKPLDAFVEFTLGLGPESMRRTPPWLMKLMLPLFLRPQRRQKMFGLLAENLREHKEVGRLDNSYASYREISAATLLLYGGKSDAVTEKTMQKLATVLPQAQVQGFPGLDHFGIDQKAPAEVARVISEYFLH